MSGQSTQTRRPIFNWRLYVPKLVTVLWREGYRSKDLQADLLAGLTVAIVAAPLAMAIAIASGVTPDKGLITAIVAGFLISALGGSRFQIGGPTGAFIVVVYGIVAKHGYDGLIVATLMAGAILIAAGLLRFGDWIKYIPEPVVTGFTAGIAVIIFTSQIKDFLGLHAASVPAEFWAKLTTFWDVKDTISIPTLAMSAGALLLILGLRKYAPKAPGFLIAVVASGLAAYMFTLPVETIGSKFGAMPSMLPAPRIPILNFARMRDLIEPALTIAFLAGVESLLSAMVADGMTGRRHRSNCELVAQGVANIASPLFGGICATGAIARTATNIRAGGRTPVAGIAHAVFLLIFMAVAGPLMGYVPLAALAAILAMVAWNMSEQEHFRHLLRGPKGDSAVLITTFLMTVFVDLTAAIEAGIVMAAIVFMHRMAEASAFERGVDLSDGDVDDLSGRDRGAYKARIELPPGVEVFELRGPVFFAAASRLNDALDAAFPTPRVFILRFGEVPLIDASGVGALKRFVQRCLHHNTLVIFCELNARSASVLERMGILSASNLATARTYEAAIKKSTEWPAERAVQLDQKSLTHG